MGRGTKRWVSQGFNPFYGLEVCGWENLMSEESPRLGQLELKLDPQRLASIIDNAVVATSEVVNFYFNALANADLARPAEAADARYRFRAPEIAAAERRAMHESWILAKAFQELLRAVRHSLEEAYLFVSLLTGKYKIKSSATFAEFLSPFRSKAASLRFPALLDEVNSKLDPKIDFSAAYVSLQSARNCLEHRDGVVSKVDTHGGETFTIRVPRMKIFYLHNGTEVEVEAGHRVDPADDRAEVDVFMRLETGERSTHVGERLAFTLAEFNEIAFAWAPRTMTL
jgi:hypothetical protein